MSHAFTKAFNYTIVLEGGYVNNPNDPGGETNHGITRRTARRFGYKGRMVDMTRQNAKEIYNRGYWEDRHLPLERIASYHLPLAIELFDTGVNMGPYRAARLLQKALNVIHHDRPPLKVDGWVGSATLIRMRSKRRGITKRVNVKLVDHFQMARYIENARIREKSRTFLMGWLDKRIR